MCSPNTYAYKGVFNPNIIIFQYFSQISLRVCTLVLFIDLSFPLFLITAEDDVYDVNDEVFSMAGNWRRLAIGLRILPRLVALIASNHSNDSQQCLLALLGEWLKQSYDVKRYGHPSWRALVRAVASSPGGGNPALAQTIAEKHPGRVIIKLIYCMRK